MTHYRLDQSAANKRLRAINDPEVQQDSARAHGGYYRASLEYVPLSQIVLPKTWHAGRVESVQKALSADKALPPVELTRDVKNPRKLLLEDGIHRTNGSRNAGFTHVPAIVSTWVEAEPETKPVKTLPRLDLGTWVALSEPVEGSTLGWVVEYLRAGTVAGQERHFYEIALVKRGDDWPDLVDLSDELLAPLARPPTWAKAIQQDYEGNTSVTTMKRTANDFRQALIKREAKTAAVAFQDAVLNKLAQTHKEARARWEGKLASKEWRLQWSQAQWFLEELPTKGKRSLRIATMENPAFRGVHDAFLPPNVLRQAKVMPSDSFEKVKDKISVAMSEAAERAISDIEVKKPEHAGRYNWLRAVTWYEKSVHFLQVTPEDVDPFKAEGKDFTVHLAWSEFYAYSPNSDFHQSDPHYTKYESSSAGAARKLYKMLQSNPKALQAVTWSQFSDWLTKNKIGYKTHFSTWS